MQRHEKQTLKLSCK